MAKPTVFRPWALGAAAAVVVLLGGFVGYRALVDADGQRQLAQHRRAGQSSKVQAQSRVETQDIRVGAQGTATAASQKRTKLTAAVAYLDAVSLEGALQDEFAALRSDGRRGIDKLLSISGFK